jgi:hypothetical protein
MTSMRVAGLRSARSVIPALFVIGMLGSALSTPAIPAAAADNSVVTENQQPGSSAWQLSKTADDINGQIKGYASATSVLQGSSINIYVSVNPAQSFTIDVYRIGWYGGLGGRQRLHAGPITGATQPACPADATTGMIACSWAASYTVAVASDWTSGVYLAELTNAAGYQNYVDFVVRDGRPAAFLYQQGVNTYEAYNNYPNDGLTGKSLYDYNSNGANTVVGSKRAAKVSFDRPYSNDGSGLFLNWDIQTIRWLERSGYDITYSTDVDTHVNGAELLNHKAFISAGHNEYWSMEMYNAVQSARDAGINLAFFGANAIYRQIRYEASAAGVANRVVVGYKDASVDPVQGPTTTIAWRDVGRPEQTLIGIQFTSDVNWGNNVGYVVTNSPQWAYAGTGFHNGDVVPGLVGYEMDRFMPDYPAPNAITQTLLSQSPFTDSTGLSDYSNSSIYQAPSGAWVFATGTMSWGWGLDNYNTGGQTADPRIQQTTATVLNAFLFGAPIVHDLKITAPASAVAGRSFSVSVTAENAQGNPVTSYGGTVHFSSSDTAAGVSLPADSALTNGQGTFAATLIKAGPQTLTVSDAANSFTTTVNLTVNPAPASKLVLSGVTATTTAGTSFSFNVTAQDPVGNIDTNYAGTMHFTSSDRAAGALPPDSTLLNGQGSFSATLDTAGSQTVTATDRSTASITGSLTIQITPLAAASMTLAVPASAVANQPFNVTVTLTDRFGNLATGYRGTVHFSSSDLVAGQLGKLPADYTFTGADGGRHVFSVTLVTPSSQTITVADVASGSLSKTSPSINVTLF